MMMMMIEKPEFIEKNIHKFNKFNMSRKCNKLTGEGTLDAKYFMGESSNFNFTVL